MGEWNKIKDGGLGLGLATKWSLGKAGLYDEEAAKGSGDIPQTQFSGADAGKFYQDLRTNAPKRTSTVNDKTTLNKKTYLDALGNTGQDVDAINMLRDEAMSSAPSRYAQAMTEQQKLGEQTALQDMRTRGNTANAQAMRQLASRGGIASGGRERMARAGNQATMQGESQVARQGMLDRLGIASDDQKRKQGLMSEMSGRAERTAQQGGKMDEFNIRNMINDIEGGNQYEKGMWDTGMGLYGANQQAEAQRALANKKDPKGMLSQLFGGLF